MPLTRTSGLLRSGLGCLFRLLYNQFAFTYDLVSWTVSIGQWREWQRQVIPRIAGDSVLEVAYGTGDLQIDLAAAGFRPVAVDLSAAMGRIASRKLARRRLAAPLVRGRAQALPFPTGHFTTIVSTFPTEFIVDPRAVSEFWRVLASGGRMVVALTATILPAHLADSIARWLFEITGQSVVPAPDGRGWPPGLAPVYRAAGFRVRIETAPLPRGVVWLVVAEK